MPHVTINQTEVVNLFHELMQPNAEFRVLRLLGEAKLGKTHLVTKIFPQIARGEYHAHCAILDLRNQTQTAPDILHAACGLLGDEVVFHDYHTAYETWLNRPKVKVAGLQTFLSRVQIKQEAEADEERRITRHLIDQFIADLGRLSDAPVVLCFDAVNEASQTTSDWLMDTLIVQLTRLPHIRVVVAGRSMPEASGSYVAVCCSHQLTPVEEIEAYVTYCQQIGAQLTEQSIRDFARGLDYKPGMFADIAVKFVPRGAVHA